MKYCSSLTVLVVVLTAIARAEEFDGRSKSKTASEGLDGKWELVAEVFDGQLLELPPTYLIISGENWHSRGLIKEHFPGIHEQLRGFTLRGTEFISKQRVRYYPESTPIAFDYLPEGRMETDQGDPIPSMFGRVSRPAIYRVRGNILDVCKCGDESTRPSTFSAATGSNQTLQVFRRVFGEKDQKRIPDEMLKDSSSDVGKSRLEGIEIDRGRVTVKGNKMIIKGGTVKIELK